MSRSLGSLNQFTRRLFSSERHSITKNDVQVIKNPSLDSEHVTNLLRKSQISTNIEREDLKILSNCMGSNFNLYLLTPKDSSEIISAVQTINYESVNGKGNFQSYGILFDRENTTNHLISHLIESISDEIGSLKNNSGGCIDPQFAKSMRRMVHLKVRGPTYYVANYRSKDLVVPKIALPNITVKKFDTSSKEDFIKYDQLVFPYDRSQYISKKFENGNGRAAYDKDGKTIGIGLVTTDSSGDCVIGPLYANNEGAAQAIIASILEELPLKDLGNVQIRCNDSIQSSATWIRPFLRRTPELELDSHVTFNRVIPDGIDFSKVFVNANPKVSPC